MENKELDILDILAYNSDILLNEFTSKKNGIEQTKCIEIYLKKHCESNVDRIGDFQKDLDWFNVTEPIRMSQLNGKLVILDFFTYCCINCIHILPELRNIEHLYPVENGLVIIGVHSAKFDNEKDSSNLLSAIQRHNITHPVVNDLNSNMWGQLKIKCWPTLFFVSPSGTPLFVSMGEGQGLFLNKFVETAIFFYHTQGLLNDSALPLNSSINLICAPHLRFPSKICCCFHTKQQCELIAVSDSGNNRILILNSQGQVLEKIGGFESGYVDGDFYTSRFNSPQGLTFLNNDELIVADRDNHAIRKISLSEKCVFTIAGTGMQGNDKIGGLIGSKQRLSSPTDVVLYKTRDMDMSFHMDEQNVLEKNIILIAMAGTHQIWAIFLDGIIWWKFKKYEPLSCAAIIGNGSEENRNNSYPQNAAFAQPSALSLFKDILFIADSESSSIRKVSLIDGKVSAVVGGDRNPLNLFAFGDSDGKQFAAKLQHPLGLTFNSLDGYLYVADSYNHKIKRVEPNNNVIETCPLRPKIDSGLLQFSEPDGLCVDSSGRLLYVADTNNHSIQVVELKTMLACPFELNFDTHTKIEFREHEVTSEKMVKVSSRSKMNLNATLSCNKGIWLTESAPQKWSLHLPPKGYAAEHISGHIRDGQFSMIINVNYNEALEKNMQLSCNLNICTGRVCMQKEIHIKIKLVYDAEAHDDLIENISISLHPESVSIS